MVRRSGWGRQYRLRAAFAAACAGLSLAAAPAQELPNDPVEAARVLDGLARRQDPRPAPALNMRDQPDVSAGPQHMLDPDQLARLGLAPIDPALLPKPKGARANAPPPDLDPGGTGATILVTVIFVLGFYLVSRVLR